MQGNPSTVQDDARDPGDVHLLPFVSIEFADGGALQFYAPADVLCARRWDDVWLVASGG